MSKIFLYLYPIEEYSKVFDLGNDYYDSIGVQRPFDVLNETIQKRYRDNGFQVILVLYPDKEVYGVIPKEEDRIIYTNIFFCDINLNDVGGSQKSKVVYPSEQNIIDQLDDVQELVIGGYHALDCVKRVGEVAVANGINTFIDLDMTDLFFDLYRQDNYFNLKLYSPDRFKSYMLERLKRRGIEFAGEMFNRNYDSKVYGFGEAKSYSKDFFSRIFGSK